METYMTVKTFNESVNADIRRMTNKAKLPTSFSDWLASNGDSIDIGGNEIPDRVQSNYQFWDEKAEHENDLRQESRQDYATWETDTQQGE